MHLTTVVHAAIWTLLPLISAKTMQYGQFNTPDNVSQKVAWISGTDICTALVPVQAEGNQNACDVPFNFPERAPGYLFSFVNCNQDGVPQAMLVTPNGGPTNQVTAMASRSLSAARAATSLPGESWAISSVCHSK